MVLILFGQCHAQEVLTLAAFFPFKRFLKNVGFLSIMSVDFFEQRGCALANLIQAILVGGGDAFELNDEKADLLPKFIVLVPQGLHLFAQFRVFFEHDIHVAFAFLKAHQALHVALKRAGNELQRGELAGDVVPAYFPGERVVQSLDQEFQQSFFDLGLAYNIELSHGNARHE
ncbi:MAG TPA: hypothetical protein VNX28_09600 [Gemmataceae bacterium]|nr:hypothetical protein [Gemmataceae bacterium]